MEQLFKPDKKYFTKVLMIQLTISVFLIIVFSIVHLIINLADGVIEAAYIVWLIGTLCIIVMWIVSTLISYLWIKNLEYTIQDDRVIIHKGILTKTQQNIPFRAITDFALERTLYDRFLKIGSIKIQTAGQSQTATGYEGKLGGLIDYDKWHSILRDKVKSLHPLAESLTSAEPVPGSEKELLRQILNELKEINKKTK